MILLDTHILVWIETDERKLSRVAEAAVRRSRHASGLAISAISLIEIASLVRRGRLDIQSTVESTIDRLTAGLTVLPITREIAALTTYFPDDFPNDPSDRIIAATARSENLTLITADEKIRGCPLVKTIW